MGLITKCDLRSPSAQFPYCASGEAAIVFASLFGLVIFAHSIQAILYRRWYCWVVIMAATWEAAAFATRAVATVDQTKRGPLIPSMLLIYLAPILLNAFVYMVFGRMVWYYIPEKKIFGIRAQRMAMIFVGLDIVAFLTQVLGAVMSVDKTGKVGPTGMRIYTAGIAIQQVFILCFLSLLIKFHILMRRGAGVPERSGNWLILTYVMYFTLFTITTRIVYRLAEFAGGIGQGKPNVLSTKEVWFYILEAIPMLLGMAVWNPFHPGRIMYGLEGDFPKMSREEKKAMKKERKAQKKARRQLEEGEEMMTLREH